MPKHASNEPNGISKSTSDAGDERIGLTEAFTPVGTTDADGAPIGLTQAFAPVSSTTGAHAGGFSYQGDTGEYPDAFESLEPQDAPPLLFDEGPVAVEPEAPKGKHGKKQKKQKQPIPPHQRKSRRMRWILIVIAVLLVAMMVGLGVLVWTWIDESKNVAIQQTQTQQNEVGSMQEGEGATKDATTATAKKTEVPSLAAVLGLTQEEAVAQLKHGATVTSSKDVNEEGNPVKKSATVVLTDEPADTRSGTPTVYLDFNEEGRVVQAGYSAATASLGYGSLSFVDAVENESIVEKTLQEAGINVAAGTVELPDDKTVYSSYASDGTTLTQETYTFSGTVELSGAPHEWSSVLLYNYTAANASGNLADTIRTIYVYIKA